jgi:CRP-like cAMP-binding protein
VTTADGQSAAAACIGHEGAVGLSACGSMSGSVHRSVVAIPAASAHVMDRRAFDREIGRRGAFARIVETYAHGFMEALLQSVACNALHSVEKRSARCLLEVADRLDSLDLAVTQDLLATILGVRRPSVTLATGALHKAGILDSRHGHIHILDRTRLEASACECYPVIRSLLFSS